MDALNWRKASYSASNGGCVEVADHDNRVLVRDTQDRIGPVLAVSPAAWRRFADQVKRSLRPLRRYVGRTSFSAGSIAAISSGSLVMTGCFGRSRRELRSRPLCLPSA